MLIDASRRVPILMYHQVTEEEIRRPYSISLRRFQQQMDMLQALHFRVIPLELVLDALERRAAIRGRVVAITFDDGYASTYHLAAPVLEAHHFPATVFLVTDRMGARNDWDPDGDPLMGWEDAADLAKRGFTLGSHTRTHAALPGLGNSRMRDELIGSRRTLEERLGIPARLFAYPYNYTNMQCQMAVQAAGYRGACAGGRQGYHAYCLDRLDVTQASLPFFLAQVTRRGYAALFALCCTRRRLRSRFRPKRVSP